MVYVLEVNPRASRTVPFVSKATGLPLAKIAARCMAGITLAEQGVTANRAAVLFGQGSGVPLHQVPGRGHHPRPGNEIDRRSDGRRRDLWRGLRQVAARPPAERLPKSGKVFISVRDADKRPVLDIARELTGMGFTLVATHGTAKALETAGWR